MGEELKTGKKRCKRGESWCVKKPMVSWDELATSGLYHHVKRLREEEK